MDEKPSIHNIMELQLHWNLYPVAAVSGPESQQFKGGLVADWPENTLT